MATHPTILIEQALAAKLGDGSGAAGIASSIAIAWREIEHSLAPVLGAAGVAALCKRSVQLAARDHPFLAAPAGQVANCDTAALEKSIAGQTGEDAAAGGAAVLIQFNDLLAKLVGTALTDRLLRSAWDLLSNGPPNLDAPS